MDTWNILGIIAIVGLILSFFAGRNAIWGGLTLGVVIGLIAGLVTVFTQGGFSWLLLKKITIICTLVGVGAEILGRLSQKLRSRTPMEKEIAAAEKRIRDEMNERY